MPGDWSVRRPELAPGGWAFEFANDRYPDIDDTAEVVLALRRVGRRRTGGSVERAVDLDRSACSAATAGGRPSTSTTPRPSAASSRSATSASSSTRRAPTSPPTSSRCWPPSAHRGEALDRGVAWLLAAQEADGSWFGRWGANYVYGTGAAVPGPGGRRSSPGPSGGGGRRRWLDEHQNEDGGWGEDLRSYDDPRLVGRGTSTASQTGVGPAGPAGRRGRRRSGRRRRPRGGLPGRHPAARRHLGRADGSPAPASPATSTSTTTSTGWCSRSRPSAATCGRWAVAELAVVVRAADRGAWPSAARSR